MKPKGLLIAVVLLAVLGGATWWSNKKQAAAAKTPADTSTKLLSVPDDQFQEIKIKKLTGETLRLRRENGKWQMLEPKPWVAHTSRTDAAEWTGTLRVDRVGQYVKSAKLNQKGDVIDKGERNLTGIKAGRQRRLCAIGDPGWPWFALGGELPAQQVFEGTACAGVWIEEESPVEMIGCRATISRAAGKGTQRSEHTQS